MEYLVTQAEMRQYDKNTIECLKIPSMVLMERAALVTVEQIDRELGNAPYRALIVAGCGNNGGDGLAIGRLMMLRGYQVDFVLIGDSSRCSKETTLQLEILAGYGRQPFDRIPDTEYDIVIDALFGVGLSRNVEGVYQEAIEGINEKKGYVCAVDIPSGIDADSGRALGCAVQADLTVAYGFRKLGEILYPGAAYCGKTICGQMGIDEYSFLGKKPRWYTNTDLGDVYMPMRTPDGNKGTFGKALVIAGCDTICGAAMLAGKSVFRMGAGMVKIVTSQRNRDVIQQAIPEAMFTVYEKELWAEDTPDEIFAASFEKDLEWADCILIGPGIGTGEEAKWLLRKVLAESHLPLVIDADALNLLAKVRFFDSLSQDVGKRERKWILTPHLGEFARLYGCTTGEASEHILQYPQEFADKSGSIIVCKDARSIVAYPGGQDGYVNTSGNAGMATAGSGDVLAGMITGLLAQGMEGKEAAIAGVYLHGVAGDMAARICGKHAMLAADIIEQLPELLKKYEK